MQCGTAYNPVCGIDNKTYDNACIATVFGIQISRSGICGGNDGCTLELDPVCGINGQTYKNRCLAASEGMIVQSKGACKTSSCPKIIAPVCVNGQSFENACFAEAAGYNSFSVGACGTRSCTQTYAPVCAANKQTYMNACTVSYTHLTLPTILLV